MSLKSERELSPEKKSLYTRAKAAAQSKNYDYAINLMQALLKESRFSWRAAAICAPSRSRNTRR